MDNPSLLLIEDDDVIGAALTDTLRSHDYVVDWHQTGRGGIAAAGRHEPDLVLLDLGLPDIDGVEVCRRLRRHHPAMAIVILTARRAEMDAVLGLDAGADDYVTKPFRLAELIARIRAHVRRIDARADQPIRCGPVTVDVAARRVSVSDAEVRLAPKEFDLLAVLAGAAGRVVTRQRLMNEVWATDWMGDSKTLDVHVSSLRAKLGPAADQIVTLRGVGYRLEDA